MKKLNPMDTCPKDKPVLLDAGYPWLVYGIWNEVSKQFCYCNLEASQMADDKLDTYFSNEWEAPTDRKGNPNFFGWLPIPEGYELNQMLKKSQSGCDG
jgi:hypothetical protein